MSQLIELNCLSMKCPRPIIEIAKASRKSPGSILHVLADDLAFESDVRAWAESTKATIMNIEKDGETVTAQIQLRNL
ncbi:MAG: sulfurtransferase TusA family protein [Chloroflexi bacterium]|jgi:TusA-related sulfurtransferase|nr:sulfurtransferase TusA family protein [Chloroflexota bacterium]